MFSWLQRKPRVTTDEKKIDALLTRGVERHFPNEEFIRDRLHSGERLRVYLGIDPTGPTLHLGHAIPLRKLRQFQELGHEVILLIGDFTARIGDPDKKDVRQQLTHKQVLDNARRYQKQAAQILDFSGPNAAQLRFNHTWLNKLSFADVIELASKMTVQQMLERDLFQRRIADERPVYLHEFLYPLMQGYDAVAMDVDGEVGGNDQTFNMLTGRTLMKEMNGKEKFVLPTKLLVDASGGKMGKTTGNMLSFLDTPEEKFGKVMSWTDEMIVPGFELCTDRDLDAIEERLSAGENPRDLKRELAHAIVASYDGASAADRAQRNFVEAFQKGNAPEDMPVVTAAHDESLVTVVLRSELVESKTAFRRLVDSGAVVHKDTDAKITTLDAPATAGVYKIGKHRFLRIEHE